MKKLPGCPTGDFAPRFALADDPLLSIATKVDKSALKIGGGRCGFR
jgi:hypothetical protein